VPAGRHLEPWLASGVRRRRREGGSSQRLGASREGRSGGEGGLDGARGRGGVCAATRCSGGPSSAAEWWNKQRRAVREPHKGRTKLTDRPPPPTAGNRASNARWLTRVATRLSSASASRGVDSRSVLEERTLQIASLSPTGRGRSTQLDRACLGARISFARLRFITNRPHYNPPARPLCAPLCIACARKSLVRTCSSQ